MNLIQADFLCYRFPGFTPVACMRSGRPQAGFASPDDIKAEEERMELKIYNLHWDYPVRLK